MTSNFWRTPMAMANNFGQTRVVNSDNLRTYDGQFRRPLTGGDISNLLQWWRMNCKRVYTQRISSNSKNCLRKKKHFSQFKWSFIGQLKNVFGLTKNFGRTKHWKKKICFPKKSLHQIKRKLSWWKGQNRIKYKVSWQ